MDKNRLNFLVDRPLFEKFDKDKFEIPIPRLEKFDLSEIDKCSLASINHLKSTKDKNSKILNGFASDRVLNGLWNNPFRISKVGKEYFAIITPDMSVNSSMNITQISYATFQNRWMGCFLQQYGIHILIAVSWALPNSYDICFSSIPIGSPVAISTLGCQTKDKANIFLNGLNELKRRISPEMILLFGNPVQGMEGKYINFTYSDFVDSNSKIQQGSLFSVSKIINLKGGF